MIISCPNELPKRKENWYIFLAGPVQGAPDWQHKMPDIPGITWISPRRENYENFDWGKQTEWETNCMRLADIILFWVPKEVEHIEGRQYAQTTRTEFGEYLARGKKIISAIDPEIPGRKYLVLKAAQYHQLEPKNTLEEAITEIFIYINGLESKTFFTADTHFGSERTLKLSRRPFETVEDMDWGMIENWNKVVHPGDSVYHLGDFGESWPLQYLNGNIKLVLGNYEQSGKSNIPEGVENLGDSFIFSDYALAHEPLKSKKVKLEDQKAMFCLFGHIHGRQKIKKFGIDVGVDANNYTPISLNDVEFFRNAIEMGYYDEEVWS